jgi:hypothetical protein
MKSSCNAILLRAGIHKIFDEKRLLLIPKNSSFVVHVLARGSTSELVNLYHNVQLQPLTGVAIEYLFARFAWTIFTLSTIFLKQGYTRTLLIRGENGKLRKIKYTGDQCRKLLMSQNQNLGGFDTPGTASSEEDIDVYGESMGPRSRKRSYNPYDSDTSYGTP